MSLKKLRTVLSLNSKSNSESTPSSSTDQSNAQTKSVASKFNVKGLLGTLEPVVGFQMTLIPIQKDDNIGTKDKRKVSTSSASAVPELHVRVIGARHLPSLFGLKTVQGYVIKVRSAECDDTDRRRIHRMNMFSDQIIPGYRAFRYRHTNVIVANIR